MGLRPQQADRHWGRTATANRVRASETLLRLSIGSELMA